ncbi:MAG: hypothetical protein EHM58_00830 [Ignavibacteriae bacterium]|nr:MAG: hypothetical protein EHM58_00830 [Ignavibacteriota bacterium]
MKTSILFLLVISGVLYGQGYVLSLKIFSPDGQIISNTTPGYKVQVKFSESYIDESLNITFDTVHKDWDFYYAEKYAGGTYFLNIIHLPSDTMSLVFNSLEPYKIRNYHGNLFIDDIHFMHGIYYIGFPTLLSEWNSLITRDFFPVHFGRFYDITEFQPWIESNYYDIVPRDSIVGVWQDNNVVGSGWSNTYLFFKNGTYKFFYSQMDCAKRIISHEGTWESKGEMLKLTREEQRIIVGGKMVRAQGSCYSDSMLIDGHEKTISFSKPKLMELSISRIFPDTSENSHRPRIYIDAIPFWKFVDDPSQIIREFEYR